MEEMAEEPQIMIGESNHNLGEAFLNRVLEQMEELGSEWTSTKVKNI